MIIDAAELLKLAEKQCGSLSAVAKHAKLFRSTLKRIKNGETKAPHPDTIARLVRIINRG
jgi:DNA invertase Pin-like site-specific DNA recombinase